jgi:hypothetical protein
MSGLEWTPDVSIYRQPWRESTGACLQAPAGEGQDMTDRTDRALMWLGHYATHLLLLAIAAAVVNDSLGGHVTAAQYADSALWIAWFAALMAEINRHQGRLCERCIAAAPTLDPESSVRRWRPALRCYHVKAVTIVLLLVMLAWFIYIDTTGGRKHPWQYALDAVAVIILGAKYLIDHQHRRLYPWCPFCRWDEGGSEEVAPPVPVIPQNR